MDPFYSQSDAQLDVLIVCAFSLASLYFYDVTRLVRKIVLREQ